MKKWLRAKNRLLKERLKVFEKSMDELQFAIEKEIYYDTFKENSNLYL